MKIGNLEVYGVIYKITNRINGKVYIGQTTNKNGFNGRYRGKGSGIERVYGDYTAKKKIGKDYNKHLFYSICKYGVDMFEVVEIFDIAFSSTELDIKEDVYIKMFNCIKNGYNNREGGNNGALSDDLKNRLSEIQMTSSPCGEDSSLSKHTNDEIIKLKEDLARHKDYNFVCDINPNISRKDVARIMRLERWRRVGSEYNDIISSIDIEKRVYKKEVVMFDRCMNKIRTYDSMQSASEDTGIRVTGISNSCLFRNLLSENYVWLINDDNLDKNIERKISELHENNIYMIAYIDEIGNIIDIFNTPKEASKKLNLDNSSIIKVCKGICNHHKNKRFKFLYAKQL